MDFIKLCESRLDELEINRSRKHFRENKLLFEKLILRWGKLKEITRQDVHEYLKECARQSHQKANKHLRLIKALFNHGIEREMTDYNPAGKIKLFSVTPERRYIPPEEDILKVLDEAKPMDKLYVLTVIYTAGRIKRNQCIKMGRHWRRLADTQNQKG